MTGVAATILMGETTHSPVYVNQKMPIQAEQGELWDDTRRQVIIDEISFARKEDFEELHKKIRLIKQQLQYRYGGVNVVFSGDMGQLESKHSRACIAEKHSARTCPNHCRACYSCFVPGFLLHTGRKMTMTYSFHRTY